MHNEYALSCLNNFLELDHEIRSYLFTLTDNGKLSEN